MAHKYRVELWKRGYAPLDFRGNGHSYSFYADSIEWRGGSSLYVTYGKASWPICNVVRCVNVTTGKDFPPAQALGLPVAKKATPVVTNIRKEERRALHRMLYCHVSIGVLRENGLHELMQRLSKEFGTDDVPHLVVGGRNVDETLR